MSFVDLATGEIEVLADEDRGVHSTPDGSRLLIEGVDSDEESDKPRRGQTVGR